MRRLIVMITASTVAAVGLVVTQAAAAPAAGQLTAQEGPLAAPAGLSGAGYADSGGSGRMSSAEVMTYWTPERLAAATPARAPVTKGVAGKAAAPVDGDAKPMRTEPRAPSPEALAKATDRAVGSITAGRVYFIDPIDGKEHYCSGATVNSVKGKLVMTAGHCVHNGLWMQGFIFAPGYDNGAPYGFWPAWNLAARTDWIYYARADADLGIAIMSSRIVDVVGGNGLAWNWPQVSRVDVFSYPNAQPTQHVCAGPSVTGVDAGTIGMKPCPGARVKGASGGSMVIGLGELGPGVGYMYSVVANYYDNVPDEIYGPYFENINAGLFYYAESISL